MRNRFMCVLFSVPVLVACSSQKGMYYSNNDGGASNIYERFNHSGPPASIESMDRMNYMMTSAESRAYSEDEKKAYGEYSHVCKLERSASPQHQQELEQLRNRLKSQFDQRIAERTQFLQNFYADLFRLSNKEFTSQYKKHCSKDLLSELKTVYKLRHGKNGYAWSVFTDNNRHRPEECNITYLDGNAVKAGNAELARYMFGDSTRQKAKRRWYTGKYRYFNAEDKWFRVDRGENAIMVQIDGQGKEVVITGIVNPLQEIVFKEPDKEKPRRFLEFHR